MRVPVVEAPKKGAHRLDHPPLVVGAFDWLDPDPICTVVVKVTYSIGADGLALSAAQRSIEERDFAPHKPRADVLVVGDAFTDPPVPRSEIPISIAVGSFSRAARVIPEVASARAELRKDNVFARADMAEEAILPSDIPEELARQRTFFSRFDYSAFNVAPPAQRRGYFEASEPARLGGLSARGELLFTLPRARPRILVLFRGGVPGSELRVVADTMLILAGQDEIVLVYRGMAETPGLGMVNRICLTLAEEGERDPWRDIFRSAARGAFTMNAWQENLSRAPVGQEEEARLEAARMDYATRHAPPEPTLSLEQYAAISAELAEQREPRADVLARHDLDEHRWLLEERGWLEGMAGRAMAGDGSLAARYGELFVAAQDALAAPHEAEKTAEDYADLAVALETTQDPPGELDRRGTRFSEWMRLDRRMRRAAEQDKAVAEAIERHVRAARLRARVDDA